MKQLNSSVRAGRTRAKGEEGLIYRVSFNRSGSSLHKLFSLS